MKDEGHSRSVRRAMLAAAVLAALASPCLADSAGGSIGGELAGPSPLPPPVSAGTAPCMVADPTGTPLRYRTAPGGRVLGTFGNGARVPIIDQSKDGAGEQWVYVADADSRPIGWIYREYITCR